MGNTFEKSYKEDDEEHNYNCSSSSDDEKLNIHSYENTDDFNLKRFEKKISVEKVKNTLEKTENSFSKSSKFCTCSKKIIITKES
jgi:hypothetical protein